MQGLMIGERRRRLLLRLLLLQLLLLLLSLHRTEFELRYTTWSLGLLRAMRLLLELRTILDLLLLLLHSRSRGMRR